MANLSCFSDLPPLSKKSAPFSSPHALNCSNIVSATRNLGNAFSLSPLPSLDDPLDFNEAHIKATTEERGLSLVGYSIGRWPYYESLHSAICKSWKLKERALNTILDGWEQFELWFQRNNGLCSGIAVNDTPVDDINPAIKCDCKFQKGTVCHVTLFKLQALKLAGAFPQELSNLTYLTNLDVSRNFLTGPLPTFIGILSSLQFVDVSGNFLTGPLPAFIGNLSSLQYLDISENFLTGPLHAFIGNLSSLQSLNVGWNSLSGPLPVFIGNLSSLQYLNLGENFFTGLLPAFIGNLSSLQYMNVGRNFLTGPLPVFIGNLSSLQYLNVGWNSLTGQLPAFIGNLSSLQHLPELLDRAIACFYRKLIITAIPGHD